MPSTIHAEFKRSSRTALRVALAISILLHGVAFVVMPEPTPASAPPPDPPGMVVIWTGPARPTLPRPPEVRLRGDLPREPTSPEPRELDEHLSADEPDPAPPPVPPAPAAPADREWDEPPVVLRVVEPEYPTFARSASIEGKVVLRAFVSAEGRVTEVHLTFTDSGDVFVGRATGALMQWRFRPARRGGRPVASWVEVPMLFRLR